MKAGDKNNASPHFSHTHKRYCDFHIILYPAARDFLLFENFSILTYAFLNDHLTKKNAPFKTKNMFDGNFHLAYKIFVNFFPSFFMSQIVNSQPNTKHASKKIIEFDFADDDETSAFRFDFPDSIFPSIEFTPNLQNQLFLFISPVCCGRSFFSFVSFLSHFHFSVIDDDGTVQEAAKHFFLVKHSFIYLLLCVRTSRLPKSQEKHSSRFPPAAIM